MVEFTSRKRVKNMYIYYVCHEFITENQQKSGGIATYMYNISKTFQEKGHKVLVIALSNKNNDSIQYNGINVERIYIHPTLRKTKKIFRGKWFYNLVAAFLVRIRINKLAKTEKPDIIHYANFRAVGLFMRKDIPSTTRISSDNVLWREAFKKDFDFVKDYNHILIEDRLEYAALKKSTTLFCPSNVIANITKERINKDVAVIESPAFFNGDCDFSIYNIYRKEPQKYLLYFGSFSRLKGLNIIGEVLEKILDLDPMLEFVFIGRDFGFFGEDSSYTCKEYLEMKAGRWKNKILVLPPMFKEQLNPFIINAEACIFPSIYDNLPNTCIEAMNHSKIVVGTYGASFEQLIIDNENGFLLHDAFSDELLKVIDKIIKLSSFEKKQIEENAKKTIERLEPDKIYKQVLSFYKHTINRFNDIDNG